jgi:hypothetical protein
VNILVLIWVTKAYLTVGYSSKIASSPMTGVGWLHIPRPWLDPAIRFGVSWSWKIMTIEEIVSISASDQDNLYFSSVIGKCLAFRKSHCAWYILLQMRGK